MRHCRDKDWDAWMTRNEEDTAAVRHGFNLSRLSSRIETIVSVRALPTVPLPKGSLLEDYRRFPQGPGIESVRNSRHCQLFPVLKITN